MPFKYALACFVTVADPQRILLASCRKGIGLSVEFIDHPHQQYPPWERTILCLETLGVSYPIAWSQRGFDTIFH